MQVAKVQTALGSVMRLCEAGNRVVFDDEGDYILHKASGLSTRIHKKNGTYVLYVWVLKPSTGQFQAFTSGNSSVFRAGQ